MKTHIIADSDIESAEELEILEVEEEGQEPLHDPFWLKDAQGLAVGPFDAMDMMTHMTREPRDALAQVEVSPDGSRWTPLGDFLEILGDELVANDAHLPECGFVGNIRPRSLGPSSISSGVATRAVA